MCPYLINIVNIFQYSSLFATVIRHCTLPSDPNHSFNIPAKTPYHRPSPDHPCHLHAYLKNGTPIDPRATAAPSSELSCPPSPFFLLLLFSCSTTSTISSSSVVIIVVVLLIVVLFVMSLALSSTLVIASPLRCCWLL